MYEEMLAMTFEEALVVIKHGGRVKVVYDNGHSYIKKDYDLGGCTFEELFRAKYYLA